MASQLASALQLASAAAPIAKQIASAFGMGKSRNARRRRNRKASSGRQGPSALGARVAEFTRPGPGPRRRRGGRGSRGGRGRGSNYRTDREGLFGSGLTSLMSGVPVAVSASDFKTYYKTEKAPVHKEWGEGVRVTGCSVLGFMSLPSNTGSQYCYSNSTSLFTDSGGNRIYFDLYSAVNTPVNVANNNRVMCLHPALIGRLSNEALNWGRYVYRYVKISNQPVSNTTQNDGYTVGMSHDVSWPLNADQVDSFTTIDIAQLGKHASGAFYEPYSLSSGDYKGDRTWTTSLPVFGEATSGASGFESSFLSAYVDSSYQYFWTVYMPVASSGSSPGFRGWVYIEYVCDFYSVKTDTNTHMDTFFKGNVSLDGTFNLRSLPRSQCPKVERGSRGLRFQLSHLSKPLSDLRIVEEEDDGVKGSKEIKTLSRDRVGPVLPLTRSDRIVLTTPGGKKISITKREYDDLMLSEEVSDLTERLPEL